MTPATTTHAKKIRKSADYVYCEPVFIRKIFEATGSKEEVGRRIGIGGNVVAIALANNTIRQVNELAARGVYEREFAPMAATAPAANAVGILQISPHHFATVMALIENLGGSVTKIDMPKNMRGGGVTMESIKPWGQA